MTLCLEVVLTVEGFSVDYFGALRPLMFITATAATFYRFSLSEVDRSFSFGVCFGGFKSHALIVTLKPSLYESHYIVNFHFLAFSTFLTPEVKTFFSQTIVFNSKDDGIKEDILGTHFLKATGLEEQCQLFYC